MEQKICNKCLIITDDFIERKEKYRQGKYRNICRNCTNESQRNNYRVNKNKDPFTCRMRQLKKKCKEKTNLTAEFLKGIWDGKCAISGMKIKFYSSDDALRHEDAAELDKFDPQKGYNKGNVSWVSRKYNGKKQNSTINELEILLEWMKSFKPITEAFSKIIKPKRMAWNKGITMDLDNSGMKNPMSKLTNESVKAIRKSFTGKRGEITNLGKTYGVSATAINKIIKNKTWKIING